jgi:MFS family permease
LSIAYLILSVSYFLLGSLKAPWIMPVRGVVPLTALVIFVLMLPALGIALVKPAVVGTTARASNEKVRSVGYAIYYTLVNIGGAAGPLVASWVHSNLSVENVFRVAALSVAVMFFAVLLMFKEPHKADEVQTTSLAQTARNFGSVVSNPKFMTFLIIFSGFWVVYWQEFITLPLYVVRYIKPTADTERLLATGPILVIALTVAINLITQKFRAMSAITLGTLVSSLAWLILIFFPSVPAVVATLAGIALGEIILSPRYYEYISRLAPPGQQGTYMGFAFLPIGIGSLIGGWFGGTLLHHFGEVRHHPAGMWWVVSGLGVLVAILLWVYDRVIGPQDEQG